MRSETVLGIDFGSRRIGLAAGHPLTGRARPLKTLAHAGDLFDQLDRVMTEWQPARIVIGLPLDADGKDTDMSRNVRRFAAQLARRYPEVSIALHDERLTSRTAAQRFAEARRAGEARRKQARNLDSQAAAVILESWLADHER